MSARGNQVLITCDATIYDLDCPEEFVGSGSVERVREHARQLGWKNHEADIDFCPTHAHSAVSR